MLVTCKNCKNVSYEIYIIINNMITDDRQDTQFVFQTGDNANSGQVKKLLTLGRIK